ncbi:MAG: hypothetical protein JWO90_3262 [Solirubrobacterales bacterium]|jgi:phospholipid/cholesterol/gamma-HCH transport system substrate-binding protein|nr:hypothetical protein [Solirubrobacterales bacterium]
MMLTLRKNVRYIVALLGLAAIGLAVMSYILKEQGARLPFVSASPVRITAVLDNAQAVTPGQGQTVQVAGVQVGKIATVELEDGRARLGLDIEPKHIESGIIKTDATALLRPRTPLKDMYLQVLPGRRDGEAIEEGFELPLRNTMTDVDLDEILSALDGRTRDYLTLLLNGTGKGLRGRGGDLAEVFKRFEPTVGDLATVNRAVAGERAALRRLVSSLAGLNGELAKRPEELSGLVTAANATFGAFASEDENLKATVSELPATLKRATQTLRDVKPLADELGPVTRALTPALQALERANARVRPAARELTPIVRDQIRPFTRAARPLVQDLAPAARDLAALAPEAQRSVKVLNRFFNMFAFNQGGREAPGKAGRDEGYLFWLAWATHQGANLINTDDANGPMRGIFLAGTCTTLRTLVTNEPQLEFAMGLSPALAALCGDPATTSTNLQAVKKLTRATARARAAAEDEG